MQDTPTSIRSCEEDDGRVVVRVRAGRGDYISRRCVWLLVIIPLALLALCRAPFGPPQGDYIFWILGAGGVWGIWLALNQWLVLTVELTDDHLVIRSPTWPETRYPWGELVFAATAPLNAKGLHQDRRNIVSESYRTGARLLLLENIHEDAADWLLPRIQERLDANAPEAPSWPSLRIHRTDDNLLIEHDSRIPFPYWLIPFALSMIITMGELRGLAGVLPWLLLGGGIGLPLALLQKHMYPEGLCRLELGPERLSYSRGRTQLMLEELPSGLDVGIRWGDLVGYDGVVVARAFPNMSEAQRRAVQEALRAFTATYHASAAMLVNEGSLAATVVRDERAVW